MCPLFYSFDIKVNFLNSLMHDNQNELSKSEDKESGKANLLCVCVPNQQIVSIMTWMKGVLNLPTTVYFIV